MNLNKIIAGVVVAGGIGAVVTPIVYDKQINKFINTQTKILKQQNIEIKESKIDDSFTTTNREYLITIKDITPLVLQFDPSITPWDLKNLKNIFDNTTFKANLHFLKYPVYHENGVKLTLLNLNPNFEQQLKTTQQGEEFLKFIQNNGIQISMDIDNIKIAKAKLKDIDLKLTNPQTTKKTDFLKVKNAYATPTKLNIDNFYIASFSDIEKFDIDIKKVDYNLKQQDTFNFKNNLKIQNILFTYQITNTPLKVNLSNLTTNLTSSTITNKLKIKNDFKIDNVTIQSKNDKLELKDFILNYSIEKIDLPTFKTLINNFNETAFNKVLNKGFELKIKPLSFREIEIKMGNLQQKLSKFSLTFITKLKPNQYNSTNTDELLSNLEASLDIVTSKQNINMLAQINPMILFYLSQIMVEKNNQVFINLEYKNNHILSNGKILN